MEPIDFLRILLKRKLLLCAVLVLAGGVASAVVWKLPRTFLSSAELATGIVDQPITSIEETSSSLSPYAVHSRFNNLVELLISRPVIDLVSINLLLHDLDSDESFRDLAAIYDEYPAEQIATARSVLTERRDALDMLYANRSEDRTILEMLKLVDYDHEAIADDLMVYRVGDTDYIRIEFRSEEPYLSAFVVNTLAQEFIRYYRSIKVGASDQSLDFYQQLLDQKKAELDAKIAELEQYKLNQGVIDLSAQTSALIQQIAELEAAEEAERQAILGQRRALERLQASFPAQTPVAVLRPSREANREILDLKERIKLLNDRYIGGGMQDATLLASIEASKSDLAARINEIDIERAPEAGPVDRQLLETKLKIEVDLALAEASVESINRELTRLRAKVNDLTGSESVVSGLEREISFAQTEFLQLLDKYHAAKDAALSIGALLQQVELGQPAVEAEPSRAIPLVALACCFGLGTCIFGIFIAEYLDTSLRSPGHFQRQVRMKLIGALVDIGRREPDLGELFQGKATSPRAQIYKEAVRQLRFEIEASGHKTLLVTSLKPREGKTLTALALAHSLNLTGNRVLLLDTNFKSNDLTRRYEARPVLERVTQKRDLQNLITPTGVDGIDVIGCRGGAHSPAESLKRDGFERLLEFMTARYDYVLLEGPALNDYSDAKELFAFCDRTIAVMAASSALTAADQAGLDALRGLGDKLLGAVLNRVAPGDLNG